MYKIKLYNTLSNKIIRFIKMSQFNYVLSVTDEHVVLVCLYTKLN